MDFNRIDRNASRRRVCAGAAFDKLGFEQYESLDVDRLNLPTVASKGSNESIASRAADNCIGDDLNCGNRKLDAGRS